MCRIMLFLAVVRDLGPLFTYFGGSGRDCRLRTYGAFKSLHQKPDD